MESPRLVAQVAAKPVPHNCDEIRLAHGPVCPVVGRSVLTRFASPLAGYAIAVWVGTQVLRGNPDAVGWLVATVFFLMMSAAGNCWDLLREIGDRHRSAVPDP